MRLCPQLKTGCDGSVIFFAAFVEHFLSFFCMNDGTRRHLMNVSSELGEFGSS